MSVVCPAKISIISLYNRKRFKKSALPFLDVPVWSSADFSLCPKEMISTKIRNDPVLPYLGSESRYGPLVRRPDGYDLHLNRCAPGESGIVE